jgi:type I restriction enzyme S subunit
MGNMEALQTGASYPAVNDSQVNQQLISFPPLVEQKRIVATLNEAFAGIDAAIANTEKNLANARELFEGYLNAVFIQKGDGWKRHALGKLFDIGSSKRVLKSQWKTEGVPFYRGREITRLSEDGFVDNELFISESDYKEYSTKYGVPNPDDIVITAIGTIGNSYIVREGDRFYFKDASVLWLRKVADVNSEFINIWLKSPVFLDQLDRGNGATVDTLTIKKLQSVQIEIPQIQEQKKVVEQLDNLKSQTKNLESIYQQKLDALAELKQSILKKAFAGELTALPEKTLEEAM